MQKKDKQNSHFKPAVDLDSTLKSSLPASLIAGMTRFGEQAPPWKAMKILIRHVLHRTGSGMGEVHRGGIRLSSSPSGLSGRRHWE